MTSAADLSKLAKKASTAEMQAGTETEVRAMAPSDVSTAITSLAAGGSSITATASGALSDGDPVVVNADGTVSVVSGFTQNIGTAQDTGTDLDGGSTSNYVSMCYDESADRVLLVYVENTTSNSYALVGNVGTNSITWGTPTQIYAATASATALVYYPTENLSVWFRYNVDDFHLITISGSTPSAGTPQTFTDMQKNLAAIYHPVEDKIVVAGRRLVTGYLAFGALDITAGVPSTGTLLTGSGNTVLTNDDPEDTNLTYDSVNDEIVCISSDDSAVVYILSLSGTTLTEVAKCDPPGGSLAALNIAHPNVIYDPSNNKYLFVYKDTENSSYYTMVVGVRNGNEFVYGVPVVLSRRITNLAMLQLSYNPDSEKIIITFKDSIGLKIANVDLSGDEPIIGQLYSIENSGGSFYPRNNWPYDSTAKRTVLYHLQGSDIYTTVYRPEYGNLSTQRFIGFSDGAYLDTETANIQVVGSVDDAQTGLTTGKKHYVQIDGTISTTPAETVIEAGTALSATEILIKG